MPDTFQAVCWPELKTVVHIGINHTLKHRIWHFSGEQWIWTLNCGKL